jgi:protein arginine kinase activator
MTPCEHCHTSPATVHITQISNNEATVSHLCETCAREKGIMVEVRQEGLLPEIGIDIQRQAQAAPGAAREDARECSHCHTKFAEFKATGKLGCPRCYEEFEKDIASMLVQVNGDHLHKGKRYSRRGASLMAGADLDKLRRELADAISREEFELAALLRDTMRGLQASRTDGKE